MRRNHPQGEKVRDPRGSSLKRVPSRVCKQTGLVFTLAVACLFLRTFRKAELLQGYGMWENGGFPRFTSFRSE